jgi:hypothetical protein
VEDHVAPKDLGRKARWPARAEEEFLGDSYLFNSGCFILAFYISCSLPQTEMYNITLLIK